MKTSHKIATALAGAGIVGGAVFAVPAFAADNTTPSPNSSSTTQQPEKRADRMADSLKKLVTDGTITQAQADKVAAALKPSGQPGQGGPGGDHRRGPGGPEGRHGLGGPGGKEVQAAAAKTLGLSETELATQLKTKSLGEIADAKGVSRTTLTAALKTAMTSEFSSHLDERITRLLSEKAGQRPTPPAQGSQGSSPAPSGAPSGTPSPGAGA